METHAFAFRLRANAPEGQKRFPISQWSLLAAHPGTPSPARRKELLVRDGVEAFLTRYAKESDCHGAREHTQPPAGFAGK